jgi:hypothetical protein
MYNHQPMSVPMNVTAANDLGFDLLLENTEDGYRAGVLQSPAGEAWTSFTLPFQPREQHAFVQQLLADPGKDDRMRADQFLLARKVGGRLFDALFHGPLLPLWQESWRRAYNDRKTLHLRLRLGDSPELRALPWEYLYDPTRDEFLALSVHTPLSRFFERAHQVDPFPVDLPLRVLVVMAGPEGYPPLAIGREWRDLVDTVDYLAANRQVLFERLPRPTLLDLQRRLRQHQYHIVHFIGFSIYEPQTKDGVLIFEDEMGRGRPVSGQHLGTLLGDHYSLRLALISARNSARIPGIDPAAHVVEEIVRRGTPAAAFQPTKLLDRPSLAFVHDFYSALAKLGAVDVAMAEARRAVQLEEAGAGWGLPQLVSRVRDGKLFMLRPPPPAPAKPRFNLRSVFSPRPKT